MRNRLGSATQYFWMPMLAMAGSAVLLAAMASRPQEAPRSNVVSQGADDTSLVIHACYVPGSGTMYYITGYQAPPACVKNTHIGLNWNAQGRQGDPGPQGPTGPQGIPGPPGPSGVSGWEEMVTFQDVQPGQSGFTETLCTEGKKALGGGFGFASTEGPLIEGLEVLASNPSGRVGSSEEGKGWAVGLRNLSDVQVTVLTFVICAKVT